MIGITRANGDTVRVEFRHERYDAPKDLNFGTLTQGDTRCTLVMRDLAQSDWIIAAGTAYCSANDRWNYEAGRKIALAIALKYARTTKAITGEEAGQIAIAYRDRPRGTQPAHPTTTTTTEVSK